MNNAALATINATHEHNIHLLGMTLELGNAVTDVLDQIKEMLPRFEGIPSADLGRQAFVRMANEKLAEYESMNNNGLKACKELMVSCVTLSASYLSLDSVLREQGLRNLFLIERKCKEVVSQLERNNVAIETIREAFSK